MYIISFEPNLHFLFCKKDNVEMEFSEYWKENKFNLSSFQYFD